MFVGWFLRFSPALTTTVLGAKYIDELFVSLEKARNKNKCLASVVQAVDNAIQWKNLYPLDSTVSFLNTYPLHSDLPSG